jgi:hypothetical protein
MRGVLIVLAWLALLVAHLGRDRRKPRSAKGKTHVSAVNQKNHGNRYKRGKDGKRVLRHKGGSGKDSGSPAAPAKPDAPEAPDRPAAPSPMPTVEEDDPFARDPLDPFYEDDPFAEDYGPGEEETDEEREEREYEEKMLRDMEKAERSRLYGAVMEAGGLQTRDDLREEYREIPNTFKRRDGMPGDEMADHLAVHYPEFGIQDERDLVDFLVNR